MQVLRAVSTFTIKKPRSVSIETPVFAFNAEDPTPTLLAVVGGIFDVEDGPGPTLLMCGEGAFPSAIDNGSPGDIILMKSGGYLHEDDAVETLVSSGGNLLSAVDAVPGLLATGGVWGFGAFAVNEPDDQLNSSGGGFLSEVEAQDTISIEGYSWGFGTVDVVDPAAALLATGDIQGFGDISVIAPMETISASGSVKNTGQIEVSDPVPSMAASGRVLYPASFEVEDPVAALYMVAFNEIRGTINVTEKLADTILATGSATSGRMDDETLRYSRC